MAIEAKVEADLLAQKDAIYAKYDQQVAAINETMVEDKSNMLEYVDAKVAEFFNAKIAEGIVLTANKIIEQQLSKRLSEFETLYLIVNGLFGRHL